MAKVLETSISTFYGHDMVKFHTNILFVAVIAGLLLCNGCSAESAAQEKCDLHDLQRCNSCVALSNTVDLNSPDDGEYYRGAFWNGLYSAYRLNCQAVGESLLNHHANPNLGGSSGSFIASLVSSWPHSDVTINAEWVKLVSRYSVDPEWKNPYSGESAVEIIKNGEVPLDYPELWKEIIGRKSK